MQDNFLLAHQMGLINLVCNQQAILFLICLFLHFLEVHILNHMQFQTEDHCTGPLELFRQCLNLGVETLGGLIQVLVVLLVVILDNRTLSKPWVAWNRLTILLVWRTRAVSLLLEAKCLKLD
jgi:hypothetical protein